MLKAVIPTLLMTLTFSPGDALGQDLAQQMSTPELFQWATCSSRESLRASEVADKHFASSFDSHSFERVAGALSKAERDELLMRVAWLSVETDGKDRRNDYRLERNSDPAQRNAYYDALRILKRCGADPNSLRFESFMPPSQTIYEIVRSEEARAAGYTALVPASAAGAGLVEVATRMRYRDALEVFLEIGADPKVPLQDGALPAEWAKEHGAPGIRELLLNHSMKGKKAAAARNPPTSDEIVDAIKEVVRKEALDVEIGSAWRIYADVKSIGTFDDIEQCVEVTARTWMFDGAMEISFGEGAERFRLSADAQGRWKAAILRG